MGLYYPDYAMGGDLWFQDLTACDPYYILPFILFTAYRALTGNYARHRKLARITWPIWFYVAVTGVIVYLMISPYYNF